MMVGEIMQANVLVEVNIKYSDLPFTYNIPERLKDKIKIGYKVIVPFGRRKVEGFVIETGNFSTNYELKDICDVVGEILTPELIDLGKYMSHKTLSSLISCYQTMLPKALKASIKTNINKKYNKVVELVDENYIGSTDAQKKVLDKLKISNKKNDLVSISLSAYKTFR